MVFEHLLKLLFVLDANFSSFFLWSSLNFQLKMLAGAEGVTMDVAEAKLLQLKKAYLLRGMNFLYE